jgi:hypothetical protein
VPEIDTPDPATNAGVAVAVPPLAIGKIPVTPVVKGRPVAFVSVADCGVPRIGVTSVGELDNTTLVLPVEVVTPVPPLTTGKTPVTSEVKSITLDATCTKSEPFQATNAFSPLGTVTPGVVGPEPTILTAYPPVVALIIMYVLDCAGAVMVLMLVRAPVHKRIASRD